jgi:hypothetical protein
MAFNADDRADVEKLHNLLKEIGAQILDPPAEYPYFPGYFAIYFTDPDGFKFDSCSGRALNLSLPPRFAPKSYAASV